MLDGLIISGENMVWKEVNNQIERPVLVREVKKEKESLPTQPYRPIKETDFSLRHETVKNRVLSLLKFDKYARRNDFYLCLLYWIKSGMISVNVDFKDWNKITKPESISRARRELMSLAKKGHKDYSFLLKDEETSDIRNQEEENYKEYFGMKKLENKSILARDLK